ncbi:hypothetical protein HCN44_007491 [Aphidius gifuensis]|nr:DNA repair protein RAD51 homolog 4-like [Aphidius gifuensis]KAF7989181.1 hypothetical protein HCN44_007491 [Aphidius gifuensis]
MARLNSLIHPELNNDIIEILEKKKIITGMDFLNESTEKIQKIIKFKLENIYSIRNAIVDRYGGKDNDIDALLKFEKIKLSTGIESLDNLLDGGICVGNIYEICGPSSAGKTQLCLNIAGNIVHKYEHEIIYIDTKSDFSSSRIYELHRKNISSMKIEKFMKCIQVYPVENVHQLLNILHMLASKKFNEIKLIIIDSLPTLFYNETDERKSLSFINYLSNICNYLVNECHMIIITTNLISHWRETEGFNIPIDTSTINIKPTLGKFWNHIPNVRLLIEQYENEKRKISLWKSSDSCISKYIQVNLTNFGFK